MMTPLFAAVLAVLPTAAFADDLTVTSLGSPTPAGTGWGVLPGENSGGGAVELSTDMARSGNGSLELHGDRTRVQTGVQYAPFTTNMGLLDSAQSLTFEYLVAADSTRTDYSPALRLLVQDGAQRSELIWEGAYNGGVSVGSWASTSSSDLFWQFVAGSGANETGGHLQLMTIAQWTASAFFTGAATVSGLSVGAGSGASAGYHAYVDNVAFTRDGTTTTYNFEVQSAVPEPATWAMMLGGFGMVGGAMRRRRRQADARLKTA